MLPLAALRRSVQGMEAKHFSAPAQLATKAMQQARLESKLKLSRERAEEAGEELGQMQQQGQLQQERAVASQALIVQDMLL